MKHWVFDLDGTLIDSFEYYLILVREIFADFGIELASEHLNACLGQHSRNFFGTHLPPEHLENALTSLKKRAMVDAEKIRPYLGITGILAQISDRNQKIALWTSRDLESASQILSQTGLESYIEFWVSGSCVERHKPDPEGLLKISRYFSCDPEDLIMVGDHDYDMEAAKKVGAKAIRVSWHGYNPPAFCRLADHHFRSVDELREWLEEADA